MMNTTMEEMDSNMGNDIGAQEPDHVISDTRMQFYPCETCKGFGYEVSGSKRHVTCNDCHDHPSVYAIFADRLLMWDAPVSTVGVNHRKWRRRVLHAFHFGLLLMIASGAVTFGYLAFDVITAQQLLIDIFILPDPLMGYVYITIIAGFFLYYRLDRESDSKRNIEYGARFKQSFSAPVRPTYDKLDHAHLGKKIHLSYYFTQDALQMIDASFLLAKQLDHHQITPLHLFGGLLESKSIALIMARLGIAQKDLFNKIAKAMAMEGMQSGGNIDIGYDTLKILFYAYEEAVAKNRRVVDVMEIFIALTKHDHWVNEILYDLSIDDATVSNVVEWIHIQNELRRRYLALRKRRRQKPRGIMDRAMTARPSPFLESVSQDYTSIARIGGFFPMIGRDREMEQVFRIMRERTGNVLLVGPPGVGKTSLFEGLADLMAAENVPPELEDKRFLVLDPGQLIANAQGVGTVEGRISRLISEIAHAGNIILGIEDIHHLLNMRSTSGTEDVGGILMNALSQGWIKVIATTTTGEYQKFMVDRGPFMRRFQLVNIDEMSRDDSIKVLEAKAGSFEYKHKLFFTYDSLRAIVDMSAKFIQDRYLPSKALDIMSETAAHTQAKKGDHALVTKEEVAEVISDKTNVEVRSITQGEREKLLNLEKIMHQRIVGQDEAVSSVASALRRAREGLRDTRRPIANFLFLGPTGVGKTEMAKTIAEVYFGNEANMIRLDMSEFQDLASLRKMIGGKGEQGVLTEAIRLKPFSLILLDELEKAHPDILNIFLQIMDDGRITDGTGKTFDMSNSMIIATSNAATQHIQNSIAAGVQKDALKLQLMEEVLPTFFRPEFLNRFDNIVVFEPLTYDEVVEIARRLLTNLGLRLLNEKGIMMEVEPAAIMELSKNGYHPLYGARPLRRIIQDTVDDALSKLLLSEQLSRRDVVVLKPGGVMEVKKALGL